MQASRTLRGAGARRGWSFVFIGLSLERGSDGAGTRESFSRSTATRPSLPRALGSRHTRFRAGARSTPAQSPGFAAERCGAARARSQQCAAHECPARSRRCAHRSPCRGSLCLSAHASKPRRTPWRDNIEALTVAIIMAVMFKYFALEAYQIPTGSMQPTLMGEPLPDGDVKDRILVDKLSFHYRDPERFEVVVFKYPLNRAQNFVKRLVGMPGEQLHIENGDLWQRKQASEPWQILRRPRAVQEDQWKALDVGAPVGGKHWTTDQGSKTAPAMNDRTAEVSGDASLRFV